MSTIGENKVHPQGVNGSKASIASLNYDRRHSAVDFEETVVNEVININMLLDLS